MKQKLILWLLAGAAGLSCVFVGAARGGNIAQIQYVHDYIWSRTGINVPTKTANTTAPAYVKYLLAAIDRANEIAFGSQVTNYQNHALATQIAIPVENVSDATNRLFGCKIGGYYEVASPPTSCSTYNGDAYFTQNTISGCTGGNFNGAGITSFITRTYCSATPGSGGSYNTSPQDCPDCVYGSPTGSHCYAKLYTINSTGVTPSLFVYSYDYGSQDNCSYTCGNDVAYHAKNSIVSGYNFLAALLSALANGNQFRCMPCEVGYHCPTGSNTRTVCPANTYSASVRAESCTNCPSGLKTKGTAVTFHDSADDCRYPPTSPTSCTSYTSTASVNTNTVSGCTGGNDELGVGVSSFVIYGYCATSSGSGNYSSSPRTQACSTCSAATSGTGRYCYCRMYTINGISATTNSFVYVNDLSNASNCKTNCTAYCASYAANSSYTAFRTALFSTANSW
jgi:hypothetical protein